MMKVVQFVDEGLGNSSHLVISERRGVAALIDPLRDVDRYIKTAAELGVRITHVFDTHIHNDFVTGDRELSVCVGASAAAALQYPYQALREGDTVVVGDLEFRILETPGHTPEHVSYLVRDLGSPAGPPALFSGGSLLVGAGGRTGLLGEE